MIILRAEKTQEEEAEPEKEEYETGDTVLDSNHLVVRREDILPDESGLVVIVPVIMIMPVGVIGVGLGCGCHDSVPCEK